MRPLLQHYQQALIVFNDPAFEQQDLLLHDFDEKVYRSKKGYTDNGLHWGYVDALVGSINKTEFPNAVYAFIIDGPYKSAGLGPQQFSNSRYVKAKFSVIKTNILTTMVRKLKEATEEEANFNAKRADPVEVTIPLSFENKEFFLVKYKDNWADEIDVEGFTVLTKEELEAWKDRIPTTEEFSYGIGSNEEIPYATKEDLLATCTISALSREDAETLFRLFPYEDTKCIDWNGRYYNRIERSTKCLSGFFPDFSDE